MKAKNILIIALSLLIGSNIFAQNENDALRYSQMGFSGTARSNAVGGAFGAVGADFSSLSINPAGMAIYKKSEISFTPALYYTKNINSFNGSDAEDYKYSMNLSNFGMVFSAPLNHIESDKPKWKSIQFGFGFNKLANFNNNISIEGNNINGNNIKSSIADIFIDKANGISPSNLNSYDTYLAYDCYIINPDSNNNYTSDLQNADLIQRKTMNTKGGMNEWAFSFSGNYNDVLYIGATLGLVGITYKENSQYEEVDRFDSLKYFNNMTIKDNLSTDGSGINLKLGILAQPLKFMRVGAAIHTPTFFYKVEDHYSRTFSADIDSTFREFTTDDLVFKYELNTPLRLLGNIAFLINKSGFVSIDYEYTDYSTARMRANDYTFSQENKNIKSMFTKTHNIRGGIEYNLAPIILRAGYAYNMTPFKSENLNSYQRNVISGGFGFRSSKYFVDFTYAYSKSEGKYYLYPGAVSNQTISTNNFMLSMGVKF